jgi:hypothetical protein
MMKTCLIKIAYDHSCAGMRCLVFLLAVVVILLLSCGGGFRGDSDAAGALSDPVFGPSKDSLSVDHQLRSMNETGHKR